MCRNTTCLYFRGKACQTKLTHRGVGPIQTVTLSVFRFDATSARLWAFVQMGAARIDFWRDRKVGFWKLCGSGPRGRFTPGTDGSVWAILATWPDPDTARDRIANAPVYRRWCAHATEVATLFLAPASARGHWSGREPFEVEDRTLSGPVAALTRATIRPSRLVKFWTEAPDVQGAIDADPNVLFKVGLGEVPFLHQMTFSVWPDTASMAAFARRDGPHSQAIRAVREGDYFSEELYARFRVIDAKGTWEGRPALPPLERSAA
jgi:spheroidene monooxygenase